MNLLSFRELPPYSPRRFLPAQINLGDWTEIAPLFERLEDSAPKCATLPALEEWLSQAGELGAALDEESSRRYIAMTCHTDNPAAEQSYLDFVENIDPKLKPRQFQLAQLYLKHPLRAALLTANKARYEIFDRNTQLHVELFREENVPLETEESKLSQQYQKLAGSLTVQFRGEERTLVQMGRHLEEPERALREEAWTLVAQRRLQESQKMEEQFEGLLQLREEIAKNAGAPNYLAYAFRARGRFDYTPDDCLRFHDAIECEVLPVLRTLQANRRTQLGVEKLRPWDTAVDPFNRAPLKPFSDVEQMIGRVQTVFDRLDPELGADFKLMRDLRLLDLANRKGKAPGGYQSTLAESRLPFIFMNAVGLQRDVETMLHEAGHAFHTLAARGEDFYPYRNAPIEFCEVASMAMELLGNEFLEEFYSGAEADRARRTHL